MNGWNSYLQNKYPDTEDIARVMKQSGHLLSIEDMKGNYYLASLCGKLIHEGKQAVAGDWVRFKEINEKEAIIQDILERFSSISRKTAGIKTEEQILAANIDYVFITQGLDGGRNYNLRGLERYVTMAWESGAQPVVILNKADCVEKPERYKIEAETSVPGVNVHITSTVSEYGINELSAYCKPDKTLLFTGASGVGKSSLINALLKLKGNSQEKALTGAQRKSDHRGKHTTTHRELYHLKGGALLVDIPGLREVQLWANESDLDTSFSDISQFAENCRFSDCSHSGEPDCAVQAAVRDGGLEYHRYESYLQLKKEIRYLESRKNESIRQEEKMKWKNIAKFQKELKKNRK